MTDSKEELIENLASIEHDRWSRWHQHAAGHWEDKNILRWNALANMPYSELTEELKQKDRNEVMAYWPLIEKLLDESREKINQLEFDRVNKYANAERINEWLDDPKRKPAIHAFTEGPERQIACRVERLTEESRERERIYRHELERIKINGEFKGCGCPEIAEDVLKLEVK